MDRSDLLWSGAGVERCIAAPPDAVFSTVIDLPALPMWAHGVAAVRGVPEVVEPGACWWSTSPSGNGRRAGPSEARHVVVVIDPDARRFAHHTFDGGDDGDGERYTEWRWECRPSAAGSVVRVGWVQRPELGAAAALAARPRYRRMGRRQSEALARLEALVLARAVPETRLVRVEGRALGADVVIAG